MAADLSPGFVDELDVAVDEIVQGIVHEVAPDLLQRAGQQPVVGVQELDDLALDQPHSLVDGVGLA